MTWESKEDLLKTFSLTNFRFRLQSELDKYHPNLIVNLSKEGYDAYSKKQSIYNDIFKLLDEKDITMKKIRNYIENKIDRIEKKLKEAKSEEEIRLLKLSLEIYKEL